MAKSVFTDEYRRLVALIVAARLDAGLTQEEVALSLGKPQSFVSKIENGDRRLDVIEFCALALALQLDPSELLGRLNLGDRILI